jgi:hypothetical protein
MKYNTIVNRRCLAFRTNQGSTPWVFLVVDQILNVPDWGTLAVL